MKTKRCNTCKEIKPLTEFHKDKSRKDGYRGQCKSCRAKVGKRYYKKNKTEILRKGHIYNKKHKEQRKLYYEKNKTEILRKGCIYNKKHKEQIAANLKRWVKANPEKKRKLDREYYKRHPERRRGSSKKWRQKNPEKIRAIERKRRARKENAGGEFTDKQFWFGPCRDQDWKCLYCECRLSKKGGINTERAIPEHRTPLSRGGSNYLSNVDATCSNCNYKKSNKTQEEFIEYLKEIGWTRKGS